MRGSHFLRRSLTEPEAGASVADLCRKQSVRMPASEEAIAIPEARQAKALEDATAAAGRHDAAGMPRSHYQGRRGQTTSDLGVRGASRGCQKTSIVGKLAWPDKQSLRKMANPMSPVQSV